ncbi:MAG: hypothetical protein M3545_15530 [Acidobacteriota bacterium]|nr:hypothetical protein [Acidobacteriota bacterium]
MLPRPGRRITHPQVVEQSGLGRGDVNRRDPAKHAVLDDIDDAEIAEGRNREPRDFLERLLQVERPGEHLSRPGQKGKTLHRRIGVPRRVGR